mmetsp:Transcript_17719/g.27795  ORF Transcript_17719/g.27795 Transcript_17719/m.27795 type:complete len:464 (-) Transcript_17719:1373-2764(-)
MAVTKKKKQLLSLILGCILLLYIINLNYISHVGDDQPQQQAYDIDGSIPSQLLRASNNNNPHREVPPYTPPDQLDEINPQDWIYLIIHYHKTGHDLSRSLRDFITNSTELHSNGEENAFARRHHDQYTKCPKDVDMRRSMIYVQVSPNFFCDIKTLAVELLSHKKKTKIKIIHLVRNPFSMAISNFNYHSAYPVIEPWVMTAQPCAQEKFFGVQSYPDLLLPTFLQQQQDMGGVGPNNPVMYPDDFNALSDRCHALYQNSFNRAGSEKWNYYNHLRHLDPTQGVELATIQMCSSGINGGDLLRMANNIIKLKEIEQQLAQEDCTGTGVPCGERIHTLTLSLDWFIQDPYGMTIRFLDFALGNAITKGEKIRIAQRYRQSYYRKVKGGDSHITKGKNVETPKGNIVDPMVLESMLRQHEVLGRVLGNVESVVDDALGYPMIEDGGEQDVSVERGSNSDGISRKG